MCCIQERLQRNKNLSSTEGSSRGSWLSRRYRDGVPIQSTFVVMVSVVEKRGEMDGFVGGEFLECSHGTYQIYVDDVRNYVSKMVALWPSVSRASNALLVIDHNYWNEAPQTGTTERTIELFRLKSKSHHSYYWSIKYKRVVTGDKIFCWMASQEWVGPHTLTATQQHLARWESNARIIIRMEEHGGKQGLELRKALGPLRIETLTTMGKRPCVSCWTMLWKTSFQNSETMEEIQSAEASHNPSREVYWGRWFGKGIYWQEKLTEPKWTHPSKDKT